MTKVYNTFEYELMLKLIRMVKKIDTADSQAANKLLKLSRAYAYLK